MDAEQTKRASGLILAGLGLAVSALAFFGWLAREVLAGSTAAFDERVRAWIHGFASPGLTETMQAVTWLGSLAVAVPLVILTAWIFGNQGWTRGAVLLLVTAAGGGLLDWVLKESFRRVRPVPYFGLAAPASYSFPSGHSLFSASYYGILAALLSRRITSWKIRAGLWAAAALLILAIGFSRIYLGVHYPTDVIAGYTAAPIWVFCVAMGDRWHRRRRARG